MKIQKTWLTVHFTEGDANIELTINYQTKKFVMTHGSNDSNVTFNGGEEDLLFKVTQDERYSAMAIHEKMITVNG